MTVRQQRVPLNTADLGGLTSRAMASALSTRPSRFTCFVPSQRRSKRAIVVAMISRLPVRLLNPTYLLPEPHRRGHPGSTSWSAGPRPAISQRSNSMAWFHLLIVTPQAYPHRAGPPRWCSDPSKRKSFHNRPAESRHAPASVGLFCQVPRLNLWTNRDWEGGEGSYRIHCLHDYCGAELR